MINTLDEFRERYVIDQPTKEQTDWLARLGGALRGRRANEWRAPWGQQLSVEEVKLSKNPLLRVHRLWYNYYLHSGLSPWGLASIFETTPEVIIEEMYQENKLTWTFCSTTLLPVTWASHFSSRWDLARFKTWIVDRPSASPYHPSQLGYDKLRAEWVKWEERGEPRKFKHPGLPGVIRLSTWTMLKRAARMKELTS